jgi:penicillin-binding protein 1A
VVLSKSGGSATIGFTDGTTGTLPARRLDAQARHRRRRLQLPAPGMIIAVKQKAATATRLRSVPEIGGGFVAEEVATGRVLAMQGGFDVRGSALQPRHPGAAPAGLDLQADRLFGRARQRHDARLDHRRRPFCVWQGAGLGNKCFRNFDRRLCRAADDALGPRAVAQPDDGARRQPDRHGERSPTLAKKLGVGDYPNYLSIALGAGDTTVLKMTNAFAILANHGREVKPTLIDYIQDRNGKVIYRADNRCPCDGRCNAPTGTAAPMPRPPLAPSS